MLSLLPGVNAMADDSSLPAPRSWDLTKGANHVNEVKNSEYWTAGNKGRYSLAKSLSNKELPSNTGAPLSGLEGLYFTVSSGAVYGITDNHYFQANKMSVRIPDCGEKDVITIDFAGAGSEATVTSSNITKNLTMPSNISKQCNESKLSTKVKAAGDVTLELNCGKGFRLFAISVTPHDPNAPEVVNVSYYNTDGSLLSKEEVSVGTPLSFKYSEDDVIVPEGQAFRGWFASNKSSALKVAEGIELEDDLELHARATAIENPTPTSRFFYDLTQPYFYVEDHEAIDIDGHYHNNHGWLIDTNGNIKVKVAGKCYVSLGCCSYSAQSNASVKDEAGNLIAQFPVKASSDGGEQTIKYDGDAGWLSISFPSTTYIHNVTLSNVVDFIEFDEASGYYDIPSGDASSFLLALKEASSKQNAKIFLHDGVYDLGTTVLTPIQGKNISIIGESMKGTVILNYPPADKEGIGTTATLLNHSENLYLQDLTIRNDMPFDVKASAGRAVALQDKGKNTICKNVSLESYQDTYYSNNSSAYFYFEDGEIHGVVDYVCGGGDVYFNRVKFVNEKPKNTTIAAPNGAKKFGYVMNNCIIETLCDQFNLGRSWGTYSGLAWLNTTINQPSKLVSTRFNTTGMNCAADKFVEYNSMDSNGNRISPASNVLTFTHSSGNKKYETILSDEDAAAYSLDKVFPTWNPADIAAQDSYQPGEDTSVGTYLVDGKIYSGELPIGNGIKVRKANSRGGFGPEVTIDYAGVIAIAAGDSNVISTQYFNLQGQKVDKDSTGVLLKVDTLSNGKTLTEKRMTY